MNIILSHPEDIRGMADLQKRRTLSALLKLKDDPELGEPLRAFKKHQRFESALDEYRAYKVPGGGYGEDTRIVYRVIGEDIHVLAIGPRMASKVYQLAAKRLNPKPRHMRRTHKPPDFRR